MYVVGLDTASNRWHAVGDDGEVGFCSELKGKTWKHEDERVQADMRRHELAQTFGEWLSQTVCFSRNPEMVTVYCEEPLALQKNGKTTRVLGLAAGALWTIGHLDIGVNWVWVDIAHWKRVVVGSGNADKDRIRAFVRETEIDPVPDVYEEQLDLYDAHCLMQYGLRALTLGELPATLKA